MNKEVDSLAAEFDHFDPELIDDPYGVFARLRAEAPVARSEAYGGVWVVSKYEDVHAITHDTATFSSAARGVILPHAYNPAQPLIPIEVDPPLHIPYRQLVNRNFAPRSVEGLSPMISAASDALIDKFIENGHCDLASDFASLLPSITIAELLGVPEHEQSQFRTWTTFLLDVRDRARTVAVAKEFRAYCFELVQRRRANPGDDLTTHLVQSKIDGRPLSDSELLGFLLAIITGGIETTASAIGNSLLFLGHNPEVRGRLAMDPSALRDAVEELLRYDSPVQVTRRTVMRDVEVAGKQMKLGDDVIVLWGAANRDSDEFENGDSFVEGRTSNRHLAFGSGAHRCLGSHLARIEISIAIQRVLDRLGDYQIEDQDVERTMGISRGTGKLPVRFTPGSRLGADH